MPVSRASAASSALEALAVRTRLGPAARVDDGRADAGLRALAQHRHRPPAAGRRAARDRRHRGPRRSRAYPARPAISCPRGLTATTVPGNDSRLCISALPALPGVADAPTTATTRGSKSEESERASRATAAIAAAYPAPSSAPRTSSGSTLVGRRSSNRSRVRTQ